MISDPASGSHTPATPTLLITRIFLVVFILGGLLFVTIVMGTMLLGGSIHSPQYIRFEMEGEGAITITDVRGPPTRTLPLNLLTIPAGVVWSPDGKSFMMVMFESNRYRYDLFEMTTSDLRTVVTGLTRGSRPSWSPDGTQIAYIGPAENLCILQIDAPETVQTPHCVNIRPEVPPAWSPDGLHLAVVEQIRTLSDSLGSNQLLILTADMQPKAQYPLPIHEISGLDWSPNGQTIAFGAAGETATSYEARLEQIRNNWAVYTFDLRSEAIVQLSAPGLYIYDLDWSPDGSQLAFVMDYQRNRDIYIVDIGNGNEMRRITSAPTGESSPSWSSDGRWLAFVAQEDAAPRAYLVEVDKTHLSPVSVDLGYVFYILWRP